MFWGIQVVGIKGQSRKMGLPKMGDDWWKEGFQPSHRGPFYNRKLRKGKISSELLLSFWLLLLLLSEVLSSKGSIIIIIIIIIIIELTHSKTILEITIDIEPQPAASDFKNLSQYSGRSK